MIFLPKIQKLKLIQEETTGKPKLKDIRHDYWPIIFTIMKAEEALRNYSRLEKTKEM